MRALSWMLAVAALAAAVLLVPIEGKPLWERAGGDRLVAWARARLPAVAPKQKAAAAKKPPPPQRRPAREQITDDDRKALDALVSGAR
jgi:hypothetical protein